MNSRNIVFFIHCCRYGFTEIDNIHITCTDSSYIKYPSTEKRSGHKVPYLTNKLSIIDTCWEKKKRKIFFEWTVIRCCNHTPGQNSCPRIVGWRTENELHEFGFIGFGVCVWFIWFGLAFYLVGFSVVNLEGSSLKFGFGKVERGNSERESGE